MNSHDRHETHQACQRKNPGRTGIFFAGAELAVFKLQETFVRFEKASGETGLENIVIVNAPNQEESCRAWRVHPLAFCNPPKGVSCKLQPVVG